MQKYSDKQNRLEGEYKSSYVTWINSLTTGERETLAELDSSLLAHRIESSGEGSPEVDLDRVAATEPPPDDPEEPLLEVLRMTFGRLLLAGEEARDTLDLLCSACLMAGKRTPENSAPADRLADELGITPEMRRPLRRILGYLSSSDKILLTMECMSFATGICYSGASQTEIAKRHRMTRAAVSKRCREIISAFDLSPSRAMRPESAVESYRAAQKALHSTSTTN